MATKAKAKAKAKAEAASPPVEYACGMDKIRDELAKSKDAQIALLGEGLTAMLLLHPEWEEQLAQRDKDIKGALAAVRKNAVGGCSDPVRTTKSLIEYYGIKCEDPRRLALEVTAGMMGEGAPAAAGTSSSGDEAGDEVVPATRTSSVSGKAAATFPKGEGMEKRDVHQKPSPVGEGGSAPALTDEVPVAPAPADPFDLDALMGVL